MNFNVFSKGDVTLSNHETEGPIAIGGNLTTGQYQISFDSKIGNYQVNGASIALAVRGNVKLAGGSLAINGNNYVKIGNCQTNDESFTSLKVWYRDQNNAASNIRITSSTKGYDSSPNININAGINTFKPAIDENVNGVCQNVFGSGDNLIDVDGAFVKLKQRSAQLAQLADNLAIRDQNGNINENAPVGPYRNRSVIGNNPKIIVDPSQLNVLTVSAEVWDGIGNINMEGVPQGSQPGTTTYNGKFGLIINIVDFDAFVSKNGNSAMRFPQIGGLASGQGGLVIFNFVDAKETIKLAGNAEINGTVFAPQANLIKQGSNNINGQVISQSLIHSGGEIHYYPFLPSVAEPPVEPTIQVSAKPECIDNAPYVSYAVTGPMSRSTTSATIEWINGKGDVIMENDNQPLTGEVLFPGAEVTPQGESIAYPGWQKNQGKWEPVEDTFASILQPGAKIRVTAGMSETIDITYPASTDACRTAPSISLPVTVSGFSAAKVNCDVELKWKVTEAKNFSHFVVQRSADARNFASLGQIKFVESNSNYSYTDSPFSSESTPSKFFYYRLQQVDLDGTIDYSTVRSVATGTCDTRLTVDFYPNPAQDELNVKSFSPVKSVEIITAGGKKVSSVIPAPNQTDVKVDVQGLVQGIYIVNIVNGEGKHSSKILKK
ncbi:choice-of-anchor A family protein [Dyadobacter sp. CY312]|nr:choice-of-anchor A family protein [Dyadobacter sp. CY312]